MRECLIYKRGCQGRSSPSTGKKPVVPWLPAPVGLVRRPGLGFLPLVLRGSISAACLSSSDDADQILKLASVAVAWLPTHRSI
jgi:hypothetical protein